MPSEDRSLRALAALGPAKDAFHGAVVAAVEELRSYIATNRPDSNAGEAAAASLGPFATGLIDAGRFGTLFGRNGRLAPEELTRLEQALEALREFATRGEELYRIRVRSGVDLRDSVRGALAARGRVFAVARGAELIRTGRAHVELLDETGGFPFRLWNRAERQIAPPLVVEVEGGDLQVAGLSEYLDGRMKVVLVVNEPSPTSPLARLIGPNLFVQQASDAAELGRFVAFDGPAIAALMPQGCAEFTYDPSAGPRFEQRLQVTRTGNEDVQHAIGSVGAAQQQGDALWLRDLKALTEGERVASAAASGPSAMPAAPADMLAAWLLKQTDLGGA